MEMVSQDYILVVELTLLMLQYRMLINTSNGVVHIDSIFFSRNNRAESVRSANEPKTKANVPSDSPTMVRY